ncbi:MAG: class I SAM-dependent methyltransferase, partial [Gaiellaceae bacterium]
MTSAPGTGAIARAAQARGATVVGVDIAERMLAIARATSTSEIAFLRADAAQLALRHASFDVVTCGFALSHMPDVATVLRETCRVLDVGGRFVASSWGDGSNPACAAILNALQRGARPTSSTVADILDERTWADTEHGSRLLAAAGFHVDVATEPLQGH